jgi:hypothetical protein
VTAVANVSLQFWSPFAPGIQLLVAYEKFWAPMRVN